MDMISSLPDEIICHIVSFLSAKEAAFASVLAKRWRNQFTIIQSLSFNSYIENQGSLIEFVEGVMALPLSSRVRKFSIICGYVDAVLINCLLCNVLKRGVLSFEVELCAAKGYSLPLEIFTCNTIVKLELGSATGLVIDFLPENAFLPALETLYLCGIRFYDLCGCAFKILLSACLLLKKLIIKDVDWESWKWSRLVSSPTLEKLIIHRSEYEGFDGSDFSSITFDTPSLIFLEINDLVPDEYSIVNLDSLVEAKLELELTVDHSRVERFIDEDDHITSDPTNLIQGLRNVEILDLLSLDTMDMFYLFREAIPVFERLHCLTLKSDDEECWRFLPFLLQKTPNLKSLFIEGSLHCCDYDAKIPDNVCECLSGYSCLLSCPLEVLDVSYYHGDNEDLAGVKHFLGKLSCLKLLKLHVWARSDKDMLQMTMDLLMLPRASVNCKIQIEPILGANEQINA